ncbi:MAG: thiamine pyrophosphate-dependent enzyme, partial [Pseudomonadota bacterium]
DHKDRLAQQNLVAWWDQVDQWRKRQCLSYHQTSQVIKPQHAIKRLGELISEREFYITTEVGQHQMWAAQYLPFNKPFHWMTSGGLGTMGYGLPAAIGVQLAHPDALVIDIAGEASILMNIQELSTACQFEAPVKVFIINNQYMGMVRQWQELLHGGRYSHSYSSSLPDFVKLAEAYGIKGIRISKLDELDDGIAEMISSQEPVLVDVAVDPSENCFPMIPSGSAHNEMLFSQAQREKHEIDVNGQVLV